MVQHALNQPRARRRGLDRARAGVEGAWARSAALAILLAASGPALCENRLSAAQAIERLLRTGALADVTVTEPLDLARLAGGQGQPTPPAEGFRLSRVVFAGDLTLESGKLSVPLRIAHARLTEALILRQCELAALALTDSDLEGPVEIEDCRFVGPSPFTGNRFHAAARFHLVEFRRRPSFSDSVFSGPAELLECAFATREPPAKAASFTDVVFAGPVSFNGSVFHSQARFQSVLFKQDAAFLNVRMPAGAVFRSCHFEGDAELRFCRIARADFGNRDNLTHFARRADFRGCEIASAGFDYAELRGETSFASARFGPGGASFRFANLGGPSADFSGARCDGPLDFANAELPNLRLDWRELKDAILKARPDARTLAALQSRASALGDNEARLDIGDHLARQRFAEALAEPLPSPAAQPLAFVDALGRRLAHYAEWVFWGWPTGYGTKMGRILVLALLVWIAVSLPLAWVPGLLARVGPERALSADSPPIYEPLRLDPAAPAPRSPATRLARILDALRFGFRLLFKVGAGDMRFVSAEPRSRCTRAWRHWFFGLWNLGSGLLLLLTLTLANTSPVVEKLIGSLFP